MTTTCYLSFDTNNAGIAEGFIRTAIAASIPKRYLGRMTNLRN